jgi:hypothetical protein
MATKPGPNPNEKLVTVFQAEQEAEALVVKGLLESAGIECNLTGVEFTQDVLPMGGVAILVREEDEEPARQIIADYQHSPEQESWEETEFDEMASEAGAGDLTEDQEREG